MAQDYKFHPITEIWPMMAPKEFKALVESIRKHGLQNPIWLHPDDDSIIDGRNRYNACLEAGVEPKFYHWNGEGELLDFVVAQNEHRRHLDTGQRAMTAVKIKKYLADEMKAKKGALISEGKQTSDTKQASPGKKTGKSRKDKGDVRNEAAKKAHVSPTYVSRAEKIAEADPEVADQVARGEKSIPKAEEELKASGKLQPAKARHAYQLPVDTRPKEAPPATSNGKCRLPNGDIVPDTDAARKARIELKLPDHVIVEADDPEDPETLDDVIQQKEEEAAIRDDQDGDDEWVAALPLAKKLKDQQLATFTEDALIWRSLTKERERWGKAVAEKLGKATRKGPWIKWARKGMTVDPPQKWILCPPTDVGSGAGCNGIGRVMGHPCKRCGGSGYRINNLPTQYKDQQQ